MEPVTQLHLLGRGVVLQGRDDLKDHGEVSELSSAPAQRLLIDLHQKERKEGEKEKGGGRGVQKCC